MGPEHPEVDYVIKGEAEESIVEFVDALEGRRAMETVHGLYWRAGGEIVDNPAARLIPNLDTIPYPAHDLYKITRYTNLQPLTDGLDKTARAYTIMTSRGCPYKCTYCSKPITGNTWRPRTVENVIGEWRWLVRDLRATEIGLTDDIWNLKLDRAKDLCRALIGRGAEHGALGDRARHEGQPRRRRAVPTDESRRLQPRRASAWRAATQHILRNVVKKSQTIDQVRNAFRWSRRPACRRWASSSSACRKRPTRRWRRPSAWRWSSIPTWRTSCSRRPIPAPRCTT